MIAMTTNSSTKREAPPVENDNVCHGDAPLFRRLMWRPLNLEPLIGQLDPLETRMIGVDRVAQSQT